MPPRKKRPSEINGARALKANGGHNALERRDPELAAAVAECRLANPGASFSEIAKTTGVSKSTVRDFLRRLEMRSTPEWLEAKKVRQAELAEDYAKLARASAHAITDKKLEEASPRDLAVISGIATDKHLLLTGQPTAIFGVEDRRKLHELLPALQAEIKRRGLTLEGEFKDVTPGAAASLNTPGKPGS